MPDPYNPAFQAPAYWNYLGTRPNKPFQPFPAQIEIFQTVKIPWPGFQRTGEPYPSIFGLNCGRRFSKTEIGEKLLWRGVMAGDDFFGPPTVRLTADTDEHAMKIWRRFIYHLENTPLKELVQSYEREYALVTFKDGATVQRLSANNPATLSGDGVTLWVVDEAQYFSQPAWDNLYPSTSERNGVCVLLGVSEGEGPFRTICFQGDSPEYPEYLRMAYPTAANPLVPRHAIEMARRVLSPTKFKQLYLAQWVGELGKVFRNVEGCLNANAISMLPNESGAFTSPPRPGMEYYGGLDLARLQDWTVYTIWDRYGSLVAWDRFSLVSWELQEHRAAMLSARYGHPLTVVDATGVGDRVVSALAKLGMNVQEHPINSNAAKKLLVDEASTRIGMGGLSYPRIPGMLTELNIYEAKKSPAGLTVVYEAPSGMHDDWVMSLCLACVILPPMPMKPVQSQLTQRQYENDPTRRQKGLHELIA